MTGTGGNLSARDRRFCPVPHDPGAWPRGHIARPAARALRRSAATLAAADHLDAGLLAMLADVETVLGALDRDGLSR
jgi:hypothetical protein